MAATFVVETGTGTGTTETAGDFVVGLTYEIITLGTTDFTAVGAATNTVGVEFVSTGVGTGTGTATVLTPANSYLSVADATLYFDNNDDSVATAATTWAALSTAQKEHALRSGTTFLDDNWSLRWKGFRTGNTNPLDWPRSGVVDQDAYTVASDAIPVDIEESCAEAAIRTLDVTQNPTGLAPDITQEGIITYKREKGEGVGEEETHYADGFNPYVTFTIIERKLRGLVIPNQGVIR